MTQPANHLYWGDTHHNIFVAPYRDIDVGRVCATARDHLDFMTMAYYTPELAPYKPGLNPEGKTGFRTERWKPQDRLDRQWAMVTEATRTHNDEGRFVLFPGYEWQGNSTSGDHNVVYRSEGPPIYRVDTLAELYECLRREDAIAIPHHTAYLPGMRGKDWSVHDERLSPFSEVYSVHGCSETDEGWVGMWHNHHMGPPVYEGTYSAALRRGLHVGAICSGDSFGYESLSGTYGQGLMGVYASELTRQALWDAFRARRVYGVTGDRIALEFSVGGVAMGACATLSGAREIRVGVRGLDAIDRIEILRDERVIHTHCHQGTWEPPRAGSGGRFLLRLEAGWGPTEQELEVGEHRWEGCLRLSQGRFIRSVPCWVTHGQAPVVLGRDTAAFSMTTRPGQVRQAWQNANVFECEADPGSTVSVQLNGMEWCGTVAEMMTGSRVMWFRDECVKTLRGLRGLSPEECPRDDPYYQLAYKARIHRVQPECAYTATCTIVDDEPVAGETCYRVRVEQRNGQRAWSSPVWVASQPA